MSNGESINFLLGCAPNWIDHPDTVLTAGGEVVGREVANLQTKLMGETWRTPTVKPYHTTVKAHLGFENRTSRAGFVGNHNFKGGNNFVRLRRDHDTTDVQLWPLYNDGTRGDTFISSVNATGKPSDLHEDPLGAPATWVTPVDPFSEMQIVVPMMAPRSPLADGQFLQSIQVAWRPNSTTVGTSRLIIELKQSGVALGVGESISSFDDGEDPAGTHITEIKFSRSDLIDESGDGLEVSITATPFSGELYDFGAIVWNATLLNQEQMHNGASLDDMFLEKSNATGSPNSLVEDPYDTAADLSVVDPTDNTLPVVARWRVIPAPGLGSTFQAGDVQVAVARCERLGVGSPSAKLEVWQNGAALGLSTERVINAAGKQFILVTFNVSDLTDASGENLELRWSTTPDGSNNVRLWTAVVFSLSTAPAYDYDSGYVEINPPNPNSLWGEIIPDDVGKPVTASLPFVFADSLGSMIAVEGQEARLDFYARSAWVQQENQVEGILTFTNAIDGGNGDDFLDVGRWADGPGLDGMNLARGFQFEVIDLSSSDTSDGGVLWEDQEDVYRVARIKLTSLSKEIALSDLFEYLYRRVGTTEDVLLVIYPEDEQFRRSAFVWGPMVRPGGLDNDEGVRFFSNLQIRERL
jgi:hypothetical protein